MSNVDEKLEILTKDLRKSVGFFQNLRSSSEGAVRIYTHLDADGISAGAILGKSLYRASIPFQITVLRQLEKEEIEKIERTKNAHNNFIIFSDFGSGQYLELKQKLSSSFLILDHHLPQGISEKEQEEDLISMHKNTIPWHINPYFYGIDGSIEISGSGMAYLFSKAMNDYNLDLAGIALIGANGDIQNQGENQSFIGINERIVKDAIQADLIDILDDLNYSSIRPLNQALAYSSEINLPGLSGDPNKCLKFLKRLGILMEKPDGNIKTLNDLNQEEKQKLTSAIIEFATLKLNIQPSEIINKLIVNRYVLKNEIVGSDLYDINEFSNLLNACGRTNNASIGIAIAMGDRKEAYQSAKENLKNYKLSLMKALRWIKEEDVIQEKEYIQYFYGEDKIPESIVGTVSSMLIFDESEFIDKEKPIFGYAKRIDEDVYKVSARAHESLVEKGVNLSKAIRKALEDSELIALGGGHPPAAGTKVPINKIDEFLSNCDNVIKQQLNSV
ncbi:MAG: hypothetical protein GF317_08590 [Candidatus Lokiarchaeota archaeon]|nr:hypothetical protein [Candidatus Lokiarchaeota archaeon]MBD3199772.1 hypothetical protein [Candidatus Lokiarchaeota archaeon]